MPESIDSLGLQELSKFRDEGLVLNPIPAVTSRAESQEALPITIKQSIGRRSLYDITLSGFDCHRCINQGYNHCWGHNTNGEGSWEQSYCCGSSDIQCQGQDFCSNAVSSDLLKYFTCPASKKNCPSGSAAEVRVP
mmetsp:Transcript_19456/g.29920  ORF Transcript_19456/g.29920 Transcript_19456/m.29920 type:complete len:136 (+) Transcript_19456:53-460(+)